MEQQTISVPRRELERRRAARIVKHSRHLFFLFIVLSIAAHFAVTLLVMTLPHLLPKEERSQAQGTIELLMVEQKGAEPSQAGQPKPSSAAKKTNDKADAVKPEAAPDKHGGSPPPPQPDAASELQASQHPNEALTPAGPTPLPANQPPELPAPANAVQAETPAEAQPASPQSQNGPVIDLSGTESESNAIVLGQQVLPARTDDRFRNRPPVYPIEAEVRGEHGTVVIVIHVSNAGLASGVDILESSGYDLLDKAVVTAVQKWHFRPALKEGQPVPFDMPFRFVFEP